MTTATGAHRVPIGISGCGDVRAGAPLAEALAAGALPIVRASPPES